MRKIAILVTFTVIAVACSTTSKFQNLAPPYIAPLPDLDPTRIDLESAKLFLTRYNQENHERTSQWWGKYTLALLLRAHQPSEACTLFQGLSHEEEFLLSGVAFLRAVQTCPVNRADLERTLNVLKAPDQRYLRSLALEAGTQKSQEEDFHDLLVLFASEKSKLAILQKEKVQLLQTALKAASETHNSVKAAEIQNDLYKVAPRLKPNPEPAEFLEVAADFRNARQFKQARKIYNQMAEDPKQSIDSRMRIYHLVSRTYKLEEDRKAFVQTLRTSWNYIHTLYRRNRKNEAITNLYTQAAIRYIRALWTENQLPEARNVLDDLMKDLPGHSQLDDAYWIQARMFEEKGKFSEALDFASRGLQIAKEPEAKEKLDWIRAWNFRKMGDLKQSALVLDSLTKRTKSPFDRLKYRFWLARVYREDQRLDDARDLLTKLIEDDGMGYYGMLAFRELGKELPPLKKSPLADGTFAASRTSPFNPLQTETLNWLISVGELDVARSYLDQIAGPKSLTTESSRHSVLLYYAKAGHYQGIFEMFNRLSQDERKSLFKNFPNFIFPTPFESSVREASSRFGISQELIYSIMRQESSFNPFARSAADAFGLMQLIPRTAKEAAERISSSYKETDDLHRPFVNIPLGASALRSLWDKYNGQFVLTVASYNASQDAVLGWVKTRFREDPVEFIEDIPYEETRMYVKLVLRNFIFYERLKADTSIAFPEWCLESLQDFKS